MEQSKRTTTRMVHLSSSIIKKKPKKIPPYDKKLVFQQHIACFKFITIPTRGKICGLRRSNETITLPSQKPRL